MAKYYGKLKSKNQALRWAAKLRKNGTDKDIGAAQMLEKNWHYIAARPALAFEVWAMTQAEPMNIERQGSIINCLTKRR